MTRWLVSFRQKEMVCKPMCSGTLATIRKVLAGGQFAESGETKAVSLVFWRTTLLQPYEAKAQSSHHSVLFSHEHRVAMAEEDPSAHWTMLMMSAFAGGNVVAMPPRPDFG